MMSERWQNIERLYHAASELDPIDRDAYLAEACEGDDELRREVESLLAAHEQAGAFIDYPPDDIVAEIVGQERGHSMLGRTLGHYRIDSLLGAGGMGEVYRARDERLDRDVAVKILPEHLADNPEALHRFKREVKAVAALSHPNILSIFDFGSEENLSYAVMELLEGKTLRERLARSPLDWREAGKIGAAIAEGLAAAHAKGIIHRDLKPENIFLTRDGQVKILDFGIARVKHTVSPDAATVTTAVTVPGVLIGTIGYMSPEQSRGELSDAPSDLFSLGSVLYEMLSGRRPFAGQTATEMIASILRDEPPAFQAIGRPVPTEIERIVKHCLEKRPEARFQSASDLAFDLKSVLDGTASSTTARVTALPRRLPRIAIAAAAAVVLLALGLWPVLSTFPNKSIDSLAVLPLANAGGNADTEYLSDGITETIINTLSQLPKLKVMARGTVFSYKGKQVDPRQVGHDLNVKAVFTGRMHQRGEVLSIQADLVNAEDGSQLWGERFDRKLSDLPRVQEEIARQISENLRLKLKGDQQQLVSKRYTGNTDAYQLYLKGRFYSNQLSVDGLKKGIDYLNLAVETDPTYALAFAGLSASYYDASNIVFPANEAMPKVKAAALRALQLDETIAEAHTSIAQVKEKFELDWAGAAMEYKRAMELSPSYARAHQWYGAYLAEQGRMDEAIAAMSRARTRSAHALH